LLGALLLVSCGEAIPNAATSPPIPARQVIARSVDSPGRVLRDRGVLVVETRGTLFQAGVQQGTLLRERIRDQVRDYHERRAFSAFALTPGVLHRLYARQQERHLSLDERDFVRGLAMGSGVSHESLLLLSTEPPYAMLAKSLPAVLPGGGSFIARGKASLNGKPLVGRISDDLALETRQRFDMLWVHHPDAGSAWVALTRVGSLDAQAAWSANGFYASVDPLPGAPRAAGLPPRWLTLRLMAATGPDEAEAMLRQAASRTSQAFVATLAKGEGARILEASDGRVAVRSHGSGAALADLAQSMGAFKARTAATSSAQSRDERFGRLLASSYGQLDPARACSILSDLVDPSTGQSGPSALSISRSLPVRLTLGPLVMGDWGKLTSTTALVVQPLDRRLWVAIGREQVDAPQQFIDFHLDSLLGDTRSPDNDTD